MRPFVKGFPVNIFVFTLERQHFSSVGWLVFEKSILYRQGHAMVFIRIGLLSVKLTKQIWTSISGSKGLPQTIVGDLGLFLF